MPVPNEPLAVVVERTVDNVESVPYAKPSVVAFVPPVAVMVPLNVLEVSAMEEAACVVTVGETGVYEIITTPLVPAEAVLLPPAPPAP